ncbi:hypothetical protein FRC02_003660 [Tulasnella sp. 418]|nr:hypothetical protein FRC02_003660 [Tulasnella sp. 418]
MDSEGRPISTTYSTTTAVPRINSMIEESRSPSTIVSRTPTITDEKNEKVQGSSQDGSGAEGSEHHVDVARAKADFAALERTVSGTAKSISQGGDLEKGADDEEEPFDLRAYLQQSNDASDAAGIKHKHVGVTWDDMRVEVADFGQKFFLPKLHNTIMESFMFPLQLVMGLVSKVKGGAGFPTRPIIQNFNGVLKPGEMCLVLGVPGSGCSTFLKVIANERGGYLSVSGDVRYAGIGHEEMAKRYSGEVVYNQEDDTHIPTLTVEQTIEFALSTKTPGKRLPGVTGKQFNRELLETLVKMLNIQHTKKTLVGNEFVRGVSGGERKRVSIIEMMATRAHIVAYDNSTRGLDASTALDFVKGLRVTTDILKQTTFVSLYQAGEGIYKLFDKVLVIDQGRTVYFGSAQEARQYFVSLGFKDMPRQTTADFLTGCTDPNERQIAPGVDPTSVPSTPEALEAAYMASPYYKQMVQERDQYKQVMESEKNHDQHEFRAAVLEAKKKGASKKSPYTLGFWGQVRALAIRQFRLQIQDSFTLWTSFWISTISAIVIGATYRNLPPTTSGGFTRGSVLFVSMLVNCLDAFSEMPTQMVGRPIFLKQTSYKLFQPGALSIANTVADLPFSAVRVLIFNIIVYFMANLARNGGGFWTFHLLIYMAFLALQGFFRTLGVLCPSFDAAFRAAALILTFMITYCGYLIPLNSMQDWLFWIYYINPLAYAFNGIMENEFGRVDMLCDGNYIVPRNAPGQSIYPSGLGPNQVCTFFGAQPGNPIVRGADYVNAAFKLDVNDLWKQNFVVLVVLMFFFQVTQYLAMENVSFAGMGGARIFIEEDDDAKERNEKLRQRKLAGPDAKETSEDSFQTSGKALTWKDVNYTVPVPGGTRRLLHDVTGYVKPGTLTALMGASGAGKTTALDVLAQRKNIEKDNYVESIIELLELHDIAEALIFSLDVEARKRLTIGVELASRPSALLFLDEPTSGLDAQSAFNIVRFLRKLAAAGQAILCTIHQPSSLLFENFDRLLLLERGGETVYFGDIGADSSEIRAYFARNGAECPDDVNPAEFMLEAIGAGSGKRIGPRDWKDIWLDSPEYAQVLKEIDQIEAEGAAKVEDLNNKPSKYATPIFYQFKVVVKRANLALWRNPQYIWTRLWIHIFISLITSLTFLQLGNSVRDLQFRVFAVFWVCILPAIVVTQIEPSFIFNRMTFIREASSSMYSPGVFAVGQLIAEAPYSIICGILYWVLMYFPMNFGNGQGGQGGSGYYLLMIVFIELFGVSMGQAIGALSPTMKIALLTNPPITLILTTFAGVTIPYPVLSKGWKWLYELNPYTRVIAGLTVTELKGLEIRCKPDEWAIFQPPSGQTCESWAGAFVNTFGGYLQDGNATADCHYCQFKVGEEFFTPLNMDYGNRWRDLFIVFAFFVFNTIVTIIASRYLRYAKR